jgi:hypothetical protein
MKAYGGVDVQTHVFLTLALDGCEWSASRLGRFTLGTHYIRGWVGPTAGLDDMEKLKFFTLPGLDLHLHRTASRHTDCATATHR